MLFGKAFEKVINAFRKLGPGLITGASDDDPSGIATYLQAGAKFGFSTLWTALITFPLMAAIQEMCARIGLVTSNGLTVNIKKHYPKILLYVMLFFSLPAITLNIGADIQAIGAVAHMTIPFVPTWVFCLLFTLMLIFLMIKYPYRKIAMFLKWLCLFLLLYILVPFMIKQNWIEILKSTFVPSIKFNKEFLSILVAILGTTISPYLFFWQATMESEDKAHKKLIVNKNVLDDMKMDVRSGILFSNLVMFFIMLTAGSVLFRSGLYEIDTVDKAASALEPVAGKFTYVIFAIAVIGTGMLAVPVLAGSQSYMIAETFGWKEGLDKKFHQAKAFNISIILSMVVGLCLEFIGINPVKALLYTAILYGVTSPVLIGIILHIANNKKIMKDKINSLYANLIGIITLVFMTLSATILIIFSFL